MAEGKEGSDPEPKPDVKPEVKPEEVPEVTKPTEPEPVPEMVSVPKEEFTNLQKQMLELQKEKEEAQKSKDDLERRYAFNELKTLNPKLAEINKTASAATLKVIIETAKEIKSGFPSFGTKPGSEKKASVDDHDSMDYDFVKKDWTYQ